MIRLEVSRLEHDSTSKNQSGEVISTEFVWSLRDDSPGEESELTGDLGVRGRFLNTDEHNASSSSV